MCYVQSQQVDSHRYLNSLRWCGCYNGRRLLFECAQCKVDPTMLGDGCTPYLWFLLVCAVHLPMNALWHTEQTKGLYQFHLRLCSSV